MKLVRNPTAYMSDRNTLHFDKQDAVDDSDGFVTPLYDADASNVAMCPRPINSADCDSAAWCVLNGHCGCDHPFKLCERYRHDRPE